MERRIARGADVNAKGNVDGLRICSDDPRDEVKSSWCGAMTPILWAVMYRREKAVELLLRHHADPNIADTVRAAM